MASITDPLVLPGDVDFSPVSELSEAIRSRLECDDGDVAITRSGSRTPSKIIDAQAVSLLQEFRSPTTLGEGVLRYSLASGSDPHETLRQAFPLIQELVNAQILVPSGTPQAEAIATSLQPGEQVGEYRIVRCVQSLEDTELYQARIAGNGPVALKLTRTRDSVVTKRMLDHEAAVLRHLDAEAGIVRGEWDGRDFLAQPWLDGASVEVVAGEYAAGPRTQRLSLGLSILHAYAALHGRGVIHGDIHPRNILVDAEERIHLVDFGLARLAGASGEPLPPRGGVGFYFEPEYAAARLAGRPPPPASFRGEQYALAALVYHLLTGDHYLSFSLGQDEMLRQIAEAAPRAFSDCGAAPWPEVERVLARGLEKDPERRFSDVASFAAALQAAGDTATGISGDTRRPPALRHGDALLSRVLARLDWDGPLLSGVWPVPPTASINYGAGGAACFLYHLASTRGDPALLALADVWAARAARMMGEEPEQAFYNPEIEITPATVGRVSPYHSPSGIFAVQALIARARGDEASLQEALHAFVAAVQRPCDNLDLTLGQGGVLLAATLLVEALGDPDLAEETGLGPVGRTRAQRIGALIGGAVPICDAKEVSTLGIAHGWAGMIYGCLRWCGSAGQTPPPGLEARLGQLADYAERIGRGARWPWQSNVIESPYMPGWCNGSAGHVYQWVLAHRMLGDERYAVLAEKAAWNAWEDPGRAANLCCGWAGRGYALLHWYKYTGEPVWLQRARVAAERAAELITPSLEEIPDGFENSLYKGEVGVAALIADLETPETAALPFFESEMTTGTGATATGSVPVDTGSG